MNPTRPTILITGSDGQLGREIFEASSKIHAFDFFFRNRIQLDITSKAQIEEQIVHYKPWAIINTAAYTQVDAAEDHEELAALVNTRGPENLAQLCQGFGIKLYHISTDYVFDGAGLKPYLESDPCAPINAYGMSKLGGEDAIRNLLHEHFIIRTSWLYSKFGNNFFKTISRLAQEREVIRVVDDQIGSPTWAGEVAKQLLHLLELNYRGFNEYGTYHLSNKGSVSWFDFACEIIQKQKFNCLVQAIPTIEFPTKAARPKMSVLDCGRWEDKIGAIPNWLESLDQCISSHTSHH
ncbi:MAG: dTDP-4-dehydrorhamnose reductase [Flavobacteriales bacterium]